MSFLLGYLTIKKESLYQKHIPIKKKKMFKNRKQVFVCPCAFYLDFF